MAIAASHVDALIKRLLQQHGKAGSEPSRPKLLQANEEGVDSGNGEHVTASGAIKNSSLESQLLKLYSNKYHPKEGL